MLIDTHCHIETEAFPEGPEAVIARAKAAGVGGFVVIGVGETLDNARKAVALARSRPDVVATVAYHPHDARMVNDETFETVSHMAEDSRVVAVGEIGLDYHYDHSPRELQGEVFRQFLRLARQVKKPVVIHTREARDDTLRLLKEEHAEDIGGIIHCFSEDQTFADEVLALGFHISFSGIVTFKNAKPIHEVAGTMPMEQLLVETDAPYLAPIPMRGKRCEPAYVAHTARRIADLRGISFEELSTRTTENALRLFGHALAPTLD